MGKELIPSIMKKITNKKQKQKKQSSKIKVLILHHVFLSDAQISTPAR